MPLPDGTSTALEISDQLNRLLVAFKPNHKPGDGLWDRMCAEYATALCRFPPKSVRAGIGHLMATRRDKFWPLPADIVAAIETAVDEPTPAPVRQKPPSVDEIRAQLEAENDRLRQAKRFLAADFQRTHESLYRQADVEGWRSPLDAAVRAAANILAQRNAARAGGKSVREPHEWPHLGWVNGAEMIVVGPDDIAYFQALSLGEAPIFRKPKKSVEIPIPDWSDEPALEARGF